MRFGFSYVGLIFLLMLFIPNFMWTKNKPEGYDGLTKNENRILLALERVGEAAVTALMLIFSSNDVRGVDGRLAWLAAAFVLMVL